jgi:hypothetical protein
MRELRHQHLFPGRVSEFAFQPINTEYRVKSRTGKWEDDKKCSKRRKGAWTYIKKMSIEDFWTL